MGTINYYYKSEDFTSAIDSGACIDYLQNHTLVQHDETIFYTTDNWNKGDAKMQKEDNKGYKLSIYNITFSKNMRKYLWNTLSGAVIELDEVGEQYLQDFSGKKDNTEYFHMLVNNGCIINSAIDELGRVLSDEQSTMLNSTPERIGFTIAPGMSCNYNCSYCFEMNHRSHVAMDNETIEQVIQYIKSSINTNKSVKRCQLTWFGGEPLLYTATIEKISREVIAFCEQMKIQYQAGIITNGRLLTDLNIKLLKECKVKQAQISLDGMEQSYCLKKGATRQDFYTVIENIKQSCNLIKLNIRINYSPDMNKKDVLDLVDFLLKDNLLDGKIRVYLGFVRDYSLTAEEERNNHRRHIEMETELENHLHDFYGGRNNGLPVPKRRISSCLQVCCANACIGPHGELYRCEHYFGNNKAIIGDVSQGRYCNSFDRKYYKFEHLKKCLQCKFFPLCMGGCLDDHVNKRHVIDCESYCDSLIERKYKQINLINN